MFGCLRTLLVVDLSIAQQKKHSKTNKRKIKQTKLDKLGAECLFDRGGSHERSERIRIL